MKLFLSIVASAVLAAVLLGMFASARPVPKRADANGVEVDAAWYRNLPRDPAAATNAFLQRVPLSANERGNTFGNTRYIVLAMRIIVFCGSIALILFGRVAASMNSLARRISSKVLLQDVLFSTQFLAVLFLLILPVETYAGFVRFRQAGFSQAPFGQWMGDLCTEWMTETLFYIAGLAVIMSLIRRKPNSWIGWSTAAYLALAFIHEIVAPVYIEPLFNRLTPLKEGEAKKAILSLARANGVPTSDVFVRDASRQSDLLNAHVSGFAGTAQIVIDDNTVASTSIQEVKMVMAHEIGHYVLSHLMKTIVAFTIVTGVGFLFIHSVAPKLIKRFGARWQIVSLVETKVLIVFWLLFVLWGYVSLPITNSLVREQEMEADLYGLNASQEPIGMGEFMIRDSDAGKLDPNPIEEFIFYDHPSPRHRILTAMRWRAENIQYQH